MIEIATALDRIVVPHTTHRERLGDTESESAATSIVFCKLGGRRTVAVLSTDRPEMALENPLIRAIKPSPLFTSATPGS